MINPQSPNIKFTSFLHHPLNFKFFNYILYVKYINTFTENRFVSVSEKIFGGFAKNHEFPFCFKNVMKNPDQFLNKFSFLFQIS
ncbi:MAG: hypothetical protein A7315_06570 [Candidatus Altiarchaeales archaeon WOR_SM1_79]|nr:MAG: hypothetical protein A7315_06570 [Candidatus Altiarchaeales archaeon WOR_SM1_79]